MINYEFEAITENHSIILHMMDRAEKYISRIATPLSSPEGSFVQIHAPEGVPHDILQSLEGMMQHRMTRQFHPKKILAGVISVRLHDPYTLCFDCSKLWFEQKSDSIQAVIIKAMGLEEEFIELNWVSETWPEISGESPETSSEKPNESDDSPEASSEDGEIPY
jgi:hypothetical protein